MTSTLPSAVSGIHVDDGAMRDRAAVVTMRDQVVVRPWSALVCGLPEDRTLLVVDWLLLACREAGLVGQAIPVGDDGVHGMFVEVAADAQLEDGFGEVPWGAVDLVVAGEHLELLRVIDAGYVDAQVTTVVSSCRRSFTDVERVVAPQHIVGEREIDAIAREHALAYHAFDGHEVARWYKLPSSAQPGLLLGAVAGSGVTGLDMELFETAISELGIDANLHGDAFRRGTRMGRREGGRVRRVKTAYQFTRRRRASVDHRSRAEFEQLVERAETIVAAEHVPALQEAIFLLCEFQDSAWAKQLVDHVEDIARQEVATLGEAPPPHRSIVGDAIRALVALMVWPDAAWIANRKLRGERLKQLRAARSIARTDAYELVDYIPLDALERAAVRGSKAQAAASALGAGGVDSSVPPLLQPLRVEAVRTTSARGARRLRRLAKAAKLRPGSVRQQLELDSVDSWLKTLHDALRVDHALARVVARSGSLVQGSGAVREANRATAHTLWGRIVRQSIAIDRAAGNHDGLVAKMVVPFAWEQLCRSGPLALWEYAAQVLGIAMSHARGMDYEETVRCFEQLCHPVRPVT